MRNVIFVNGPPGVGKTTAIKWIVEALHNNPWWAKELKPSLNGKAAVHALLDLPGIGANEFEDVKDEERPEFFGRTPREWYIGLMEGMKNWYGQGLFGELMVREMKRTVQPNLFVYDAGFVEEAEVVRNFIGSSNCLLLRIYRPGCDFANDSRQYITGLLARRHELDIHNRFDLDMFRVQVLNGIAPFLGFEQGWFEDEDNQLSEDDFPEEEAANEPA